MKTKMSLGMKQWQDFLDSLSTRGGNIFVLSVCLFILFVIMIHVSHDSQDATLVSVSHDLVVGFGGALLGSLTGGASRQQMADRTMTPGSLADSSHSEVTTTSVSSTDK